MRRGPTPAPAAIALGRLVLLTVVLCLVSAGCGRISFEAVPRGADGGVPVDAGPSDAAGDSCVGPACDGGGGCGPTGLPCDTPPSDCYEAAGACTEGECRYTLRMLGAACDDGDLLTGGDVCDAMGVCAGTATAGWPLVFDNTFGAVLVRGLGVDGSGGLYGAVQFAGSWNGSGFDTNLTAPGISYTNDGWVDTAMLKLDAADASPTWDHSYAGRSGRVEAYCFEVLPDGTSFAAGHLRNAGEFGTFGSRDAGAQQNPLILTHDAAGSLSAANCYEPGSQNAQIHDISVVAGFVAITGVYGNNVDFGAGGIGASNGDDGYVALFDRSSSLRWARQIGGVETVYGKAVHVTTSGRSWVAGQFAGTVDYGNGVQTTAGGNDIYLAAYDGGGAYRWGYSWGSPASESNPEIVGDDTGNTYVVGRFGDSFSIAGSPPLSSEGSDDIYVAAFDDLGALRWLETFGSAASDSLLDVGFLGDGSLWVAGAFDGTLMAGALAAASAGGADGFVVVLDASDGTPTGLSVMASPSDLDLSAVAVDEARAVVWAGGQFTGSVQLGSAMPSAGKAYVYPFPFAP